MKYSLGVAKELANFYGLGERDISPEAYAAIKEMEEKRGLLYDAPQDILLAATEICSQYDTVESHQIAADAYRRLPATYREDAIRELSRAIDLDGGGTPFRVYQLGLLYAKGHNFGEAIRCIGFAIEREPENPTYYIQLAKVIAMQNRLDDALAILDSFKRSGHYRDRVVTKSMGVLNGKIGIDLCIKDIEEKKARGYMYRPRAAKE